MANIKKPNLRNTSIGGGNQYIRVFVDGEVRVVMLDEDAQAHWDDITHLEVEKVHYNSSKAANDKDGERTGPAFDRYEIVDYSTRAIKLADAEFEFKLEGYTRKLLKESVLTPEQLVEADLIG